MTPESSSQPTRRVVCGVLLAGFAGPVVAACSSGAGGGGVAAPTTTPKVAKGAALVEAAKVPVGGMALLVQHGLVVTQPKPGEFKAFSALCTHQGNQLDPQLFDGTLHCSRHGSEFSPVDGHVEQGPATRALPEIPVTVRGGQVVRG